MLFLSMDENSIDFWLETKRLFARWSGGSDKFSWNLYGTSTGNNCKDSSRKHSMPDRLWDTDHLISQRLKHLTTTHVLVISMRIFCSSLIARHTFKHKACHCCSEALHALLKTKSVCTGNAKYAVMMRFSSFDLARLEQWQREGVTVGDEMYNNWIKTTQLRGTTGYTWPENIKKRLLKNQNGPTHGLFFLENCSMDSSL